MSPNTTHAHRRRRGRRRRPRPSGSTTDRRGGAHDAPNEEPLTGATATKVREAALAEVSGTVLRVETDEGFVLDVLDGLWTERREERYRPAPLLQRADGQKSRRMPDLLTERPVSGS